jgi:hypothetical protein
MGIHDAEHLNNKAVWLIDKPLNEPRAVRVLLKDLNPLSEISWINPN